ncbi:putative exonuclease [Pseudomonas phage SoKa]|uniref:Exonuclease n=1 Tax=Pseudomonas phage SoKa TaxID=2930393 RepID=A0AAE9KGE8_9CAUD|nr:putative exonuclease [Pseudomonas phage SoKa]
MDWLAEAIAQAADEPMPCSVIPDVVPGRLVGIDGDYLAYFMAGNDDTDSGTARRNTMSRIATIKEMTGAEGVVIHLSADGCSKADRFLIATVQPYQEQREGSKRPKNWRTLREFMESYRGPAFTPKIWGDREADDGMAYMQQKWYTEGKQELIVTATRDKDMRQYPGWHMDWMTYQLTFVPQGAYEVIGQNDLIYGHKWLWLQTLQGDGADHIKGLPFHLKPNGKWESVGDARALKRLEGIDNDADAFDEVLRLYDTYYQPAAGITRLAETLLLVWLRRDKLATYTDMLDWLLLRDDQKAKLREALLQHAARVAEMKAEVKRIEANQQST